MNANVVKTINYIKRNGIVKGYYAVRERLDERKEVPYAYEPISHEERLSQVADAYDCKLKFSILVPAYEAPSVYMRELIESVKAQTYSGWELIIADASVTDIVKNTVGEFADTRIKYVRLTSNGGISANSNAGLKYCEGDYIALLDHDDLITQDALYRFNEAIGLYKQKGIELQMLYSDEDKTDGENTVYFDSNTKPKFNLDLILSNNYICHFLALKAELIMPLGFRSDYDGAQDHDLILRAVSALKKQYGKAYAEYIYHEPRVLYHWRCHINSTAANPKSKEYAYVAGKKAVEDYLKRERITAVVTETSHVGFFYVDYKGCMFTERPEVCGIGYRVYGKGGQVTGGVYDENMKPYFEGLNRHYSGGHLHRADCQMEVPYIDPRYMKAPIFVQKEYDKFLKENEAQIQDPLKLTKAFCDMMRAKGYIFVYDPSITIKEGRANG